jgi:hypothetical protein
MRKLIAIVMLLGYYQASYSQNISIAVRLPQPYILTDSVLYVEVYVFSTNPLSSVTAIVRGRQTSLNVDNYGYPPSYGGSLTLVGLPQDTLNVQIVATDVQNNWATVSQPFIYDRAPVLVVDSPLNWSVASPLLHIKARCFDSAGCKLSVSGGDAGGGINYSSVYAGDSIDSVIDLSGNEGVVGHVTINAYDRHGQYTFVSKQIFVENSSHLRQIFAAGDQILDFNYNKVLVSNPSWGRRYSETDLNPYVYRSRIVNIISGDSIALPYQGPLSVNLEPNPSQNHVLTPYGAIFSVADTSTYLTSLYDWHAGSLNSLGPLNSGLALRVSGNYAIWSNDSILHLRQLQMATDSIISSSALNWGNDLAASGVVTYAGTDYNIYRYANNSSTQITNRSDNKSNLYPATDGSHIVYTRGDPCCTSQHYSLHLYNGRSDSLLSDMDTIEPSPMNNYQLNNGFIAYTKPDAAYHLQVWVMDRSGNSSQITSFAGNSTIDLLGPNGDLTLICTAGSSTRRRYFANRSTGLLTDIGTANGLVYYRDSAWYLALGRMLYKIDPGLYPYNPAEPQISGLNSNYCSNQGVQKIKLLNLPDSITSVKVALDDSSLSVASDSSVSFNVTDLTVGSHEIEIAYCNATGSQTLTDTFTVIAAVVPIVKLSSTISTVTSLVDPVILTAIDVAGGGSNPLFTFASDRNFSTVLQREGTVNKLSINPETLAVGVNPFYVRVRTSDSCYSRSTGVDSLQLVRNGITGIIDPEFPNYPISCFPNPFGQYITISGFQSDKSYWIAIHNNLGQSIYQRELSNSNVLAIKDIALSEGVYWLSIFDYKKNRMIGTMIVFKK